MTDLRTIADLSAALLTPIIGIVTTFILINQYRLERRRLRLDLYEKRYAVFRAAMDYIASMMRRGKTTPDLQAAYLEGIRDRGLLFDREVQDLLDEIWRASIQLEMHQDIFADLPVGPERSTHVQAAGEIKKQLPTFGTKAHEVFGRYLKMTEK